MKTMTVLMCETTHGVLCRGIVEDATVFQNLLYSTTEFAVERIGEQYSSRYKVVFNLPEGDTT